MEQLDRGQVRPHPFQTLILLNWKAEGGSRAIQKFHSLLKWFCTWAGHPSACASVMFAQQNPEGLSDVVGWSSQHLGSSTRLHPTSLSLASLPLTILTWSQCPSSVDLQPVKCLSAHQPRMASPGMLAKAQMTVAEPETKRFLSFQQLEGGQMGGWPAYE